MYANTTKIANMMMTIICTGMLGNNGVLFTYLRKKDLTPNIMQATVKIYNSTSLKGALICLGK